MKTTILAVFFALALMPINANAFNVEKDKQLHFNASAIISSGTYLMHQGLTSNFSVRAGYLESSLVAMTTCLTIGLAKEVYDESYGSGFDNKDMLANAGGCAIGTLASIAINSTVYIAPEINPDGDFSGIKITKLL